jgi:hypothetical protein
MCRPVDTKLWKGWLYFINTVMVVVGLALFGVSVWASVAPQAAIFRTQYSHLVYWGIAVSIIIVTISSCGCVGANQAESNEKQGSKHWCLSAYFVILSLLFCLQVGTMAASIVLHVQMDEALDVPYNAASPSSLDEEITHKLLLTHPQVWKDIQDSFQCCGWGVTDERVPAIMIVNEGKMTVHNLTTGTICAQSTENPCRGYVITWVMDDLSWVIVICVLIIAVESMAMLSTVCICCCARQSDWEKKLSVQHSDFEKYSQLPGGELEAEI